MRGKKRGLKTVDFPLNGLAGTTAHPLDVIRVLVTPVEILEIIEDEDQFHSGERSKFTQHYLGHTSLHPNKIIASTCP